MQENYTAPEQFTREDFRLDLYSVFRALLGEWPTILMLTASAVLLSYVLLFGVVTPSYRTTSAVALYNANEFGSANNMKTENLYYALRSAAEGAHYCNDLLSQGEFRKMVSEELGESFGGGISSSIDTNGNLITIKVTSGNPGTILRDSRAVLTAFQKAGESVMGGMKIIVVQEPIIESSASLLHRNIKLAVAMGILAFLAICTLMGWYFSSKYTVRKSTELKIKVGADLLAVVPQAAGGKPLIADPGYAGSASDSAHAGSATDRASDSAYKASATDPAYAESVRILAVRLLNETERTGGKTLLLTGAAKGEGNSTLAANLALALAEISPDVVLLDMDLQNPSLARILKIENENFTQLSKILENGIPADPSAAACKVPGTKLSVLLNSQRGPQSADYYTDGVRQLIEKLSEKAKIIVIDTPPASTAAVTEELVSLADISLVTVRENYTEVQELISTVEMVQNTGNMLGCVFNAARRDMASSDSHRGTHAARRDKVSSDSHRGGHHVG